MILKNIIEVLFISIFYSKIHTIKNLKNIVDKLQNVNHYIVWFTVRALG